MKIKLKRIYDESAKADGVRILVDRLWPRGVSKEKANLDHWLKEIGPTDELRKSFHEDERSFKQFKEKYLKELQSGEQKEALDELKKIADDTKQITLLFAAKNKEENQAVILKEKLED
ncbi:DUF488 domain-containing protein [Oceanobacillus alkalisoli]|uniref:DUF488 domain-containing protein n=1 Tax=Oceanobacillus alkalisoli TaxID=2925113 RepID=UPI001F1227FA|nr:DUF488 family protein [Oceanobacillus alkalisoli]MCF3944675.1 DUF488 family protein [Oceanobacillus alkalisoli]